MEQVEVIQVFLQGKGIATIDQVKIPSGGRVRDVIKAARPHGLPVVEGDEVLIWLEGADEPLELELGLAEAGIGEHSRLHVHTCRKVEVSVTYNGQVKTRHFSPARTVEAVTEWADREFGLSEVDATDHVLQVSGTTDQPAGDLHIGSLVNGPSCTIGFDLVPKSRIQGSYDRR